MRVKKVAAALLCAALISGMTGTGGGRDEDQFGISCGGSGYGGRAEYSGPGNRSHPEKR